ncbi:MAG TPA: peptidylprolyl isomerase [Rhizomicrobium sp.]
MLKKRATFAFAFCSGLFVLAAASVAAPEGAKPHAPATPPKSDADKTTASLGKPANELPDANAEAEAIRKNTIGVAAIVNGSPISDYDLRQRLALLNATSGVKAENEDQRKALRSQILRQLETEKIQTQEANRKSIVIGSEDVDKYINNLIKENGLTPEKLKQVLAGSGVNMATLRSQIAVQIAWQKAVEDEFGGEVQVKPGDVDQEYARVRAGANKPHFLVAEIFLGVDNPEQDSKIKEDAERIYEQIKNGAPFNTIARQFSQSPSAASGGDLGTVEDGQLAPELNASIEKLRVGEVTPPIRSVGGYYILFLRRRWEPVGTKVSTQDDSKPLTSATPIVGMLLPTGPKPPPELQQRALQMAQQISERAQSCEELAKVASNIRGASYQDFARQNLKLSDLSPQIQSEAAKLQAGGVSPPFPITGVGIEILARCDKAAPKLEVWQMPSREDVENQLFQDKISTLARGYLARLRRNADVQDR